MLESRWPSGMVSIIFLLQKEVSQYQYFGIDVGSSLVSTFKQINSQQKYLLVVKESTFFKSKIFQFRFFQRGCFSFLRNLFKRFKFGSKKTLPPQKKSRTARRKEMAAWGDTLHTPTDLITGEVLMARQTV